MARRAKIYEGKAKILYEGPEPGTIVQYFKDDATAFNAEKKEVIEGANQVAGDWGHQPLPYPTKEEINSKDQPEYHSS